MRRDYVSYDKNRPTKINRKEMETKSKCYVKKIQIEQISNNWKNLDIYICKK